MSLKTALRSALALVLCASLSACATGRAYENFKNTMQRQVGKSADDPYISMNRYPERRGTARVLSSGNIEQQYRFGPGCQVYFEIDKATRKIIGWRYEGSEQNCAIVP